MHCLLPCKNKTFCNYAVHSLVQDKNLIYGDLLLS